MNRQLSSHNAKYFEENLQEMNSTEEVQVQVQSMYAGRAWGDWLLQTLSVDISWRTSYHEDLSGLPRPASSVLTIVCSPADTTQPRPAPHQALWLRVQLRTTLSVFTWCQQTLMSQINMENDWSPPANLLRKNVRVLMSVAALVK